MTAETDLIQQLRRVAADTYRCWVECGGTADERRYDPNIADLFERAAGALQQRDERLSTQDAHITTLEERLATVEQEQERVRAAFCTCGDEEEYGPCHLCPLLAPPPKVTP